MKTKFYFLILIFILSCNISDPHWRPIISDALNQAIALEKLPNIRTVLSNTDTIWIYPIQMEVDTSFYDEILADKLPFHIDRWIIKPIDNDAIKKKSENSKR